MFLFVILGFCGLLPHRLVQTIDEIGGMSKANKEGDVSRLIAFFLLEARLAQGHKN
jgi:hypothetical protein